MNTLKLTLKKKWFDLIDQGIKTEEYREIKPYWYKRLVFEYEESFKDTFITSMKTFDLVEFTNGYNSTSPKIVLECQNISVGQGLTEWGAVQGQLYFIIKLGRKVAYTSKTK